MKFDTSKIHPELQKSAKYSPNFSFNKKNLWLINLGISVLPAPRAPEGIHVKNIHIPGKDGQTNLRLRLYRPQSASEISPALVWLHGGGYITGKPEMDDHICIEFARELGIPVISVDYRRAPKHPFPAALEDCYSALLWVKSQLPGVDENRIAIGGASAGGGLAAALAQLAYDRREVDPVFQLLVYPMLDDRTVLRADYDDDSHITWNQSSNRFGWESYLGQKCGTEDLPGHAVPARRANLSSLPPAWIGVGTLDLFHDEDVAYAKRLKDSGVECALHIVPGAFHGFDVFDRHVPVVQEFRKSQILSLKKHLFSQSS